MAQTKPQTMTIGRLAKAAGVGVETIRYYQQRGLLPVPMAVGAYRHYPVGMNARIRFIKRAQELGCAFRRSRPLIPIDAGRVFRGMSAA